MVARYVRDVEVPGSNPGSPTSTLKKRGTSGCPSSFVRGFDLLGIGRVMERVEFHHAHYVEVILVG